jgi:hypothetical protein
MTEQVVEPVEDQANPHRFTVALSPRATDRLDFLKHLSGSGSRSIVIEDMVDIVYDLAFHEANLTNAANAEDEKSFSSILETLEDHMRIKTAKYSQPFSRRLNRLKHVGVGPSQTQSVDTATEQSKTK